MLAYITIVLGLILTCGLGAYATYGWRDHWCFPWVMFGSANGLVVFWIWLVSLMTTNRQLFIASLLWDVGVTGVYILVPILMFNLKLDKWTIWGTIITVLGVVLLKMGEE